MKFTSLLQRVLVGAVVACFCLFESAIPGHALEPLPVPETTGEVHQPQESPTPEPQEPFSAPAEPADHATDTDNQAEDTDAQAPDTDTETPASEDAPANASVNRTFQPFNVGVASIVESGTDGTVPWTKDDTGLVTFGAGTFGATDFNTRPWKQGEPVTRIVFDSPEATILPVDSSGFFGLSTLTEIQGIGQLNTANVTNMSGLFYDASRLQTLDLTNFDTTNVTTMNSMFYDASRLQTLDLTNFDTTNVTNMSNMFSNTSALSALYLGPDTLIQNSLLGNPTGLSWYEVDSTDPATLTVGERVGTGTHLADATVARDG